MQNGAEGFGVIGDAIIIIDRPTVNCRWDAPNGYALTKLWEGGGLATPVLPPML